MDLTPWFTSCVTELRQSREGDFPTLDKNRILQSKRVKHSFSLRALEIHSHILKIQSFLKDAKDSYVAEKDKGGLCLRERETIDVETQSNLSRIQYMIESLETELQRLSNINHQTRIHFTHVLQILRSSLSSAFSFYAEQRANVLETQLLNNEMSKLSLTTSSYTTKKTTQSTKKLNSSYSSPTINSTPYEESHNDNEDQDLSPEELRMLEEENSGLYSRLLSTKDDVRALETKVSQIAELQNTFTEKILSQKNDVNLIYENTIASTEHVKDGNEELRKAIQNKASTRVNILFFLLVLSLSLLFLDWYND